LGVALAKLRQKRPLIYGTRSSNAKRIVNDHLPFYRMVGVDIEKL
jgi:L-fucose isomerase-like protein